MGRAGPPKTKIYRFMHLAAPPPRPGILRLGSSGAAATWGDASKHVDDQREAWAAGEMVPMLYEEEAVRAEAGSTIAFEPAARL